MGRPKIEPVVWRAPAPGPKPTPAPLPPLTVHPVNGFGAEDVLVDIDGTVLTGLSDGRIVRLAPDGSRIEVVAATGGRPLGLEHHPDGLLVCDAHRGLLLVTGSDVAVLVPRGPDLNLCNNAAVAEDGTVYFTDSTSRFDLEHYRADLIEHSSTGRLLRRTPDGAVEVLLTGLSFANGVALTPDRSGVIVSDMAAYRLHKVPVTGPTAAASAATVFVDDLPGFADNLSLGTDGLLWLAFASPRDPVLDALLGKPPVLRQLLWRLPQKLQPAPQRTVWVRALDPRTGATVHDFHGTPPDFHMATGVRESGGTVWLGSLQEPAVAAFTVPK
ncbi:SMP-30/gluconolactonase/LRE family protein [Actinokineospora sp. PR83]|uniref:SMP-30/gluconolactonase/LRE family protein n=1 Tax=Actinokineospora sp. PR83 TaxID=2884908 RepID=UPI001F205D64|nr:SMP-30/gluconolactonase/LRE family protein [Actinokineospora sp. PR83]MCG8917126.1 SMP-30/gluconolactonase/LRE family protein [Actinokineospora sp. PR83]